jgi:hypothetical protein
MLAGARDRKRGDEAVEELQKRNIIARMNVVLIDIVLYPYRALLYTYRLSPIFNHFIEEIIFVLID